MTVVAFSDAAANDPQLRFDNIQGDVLVGLQKDVEAFVFFTIDDVAAFRRALKESVVSQVTSTADVRRREEQIAEAKAKGLHTRFLFLGLNIAFTARGLQRLGVNTANLEGVFHDGAHNRADDMGDHLGDWRAPFAAGHVDGLLLITAPDQGTADNHADAIVHMFGASISVVYRELGAVRPQRAHEHFGFLDGVSQPGIRGLTKPDNPTNKNQGRPGQDLLWPGEFVFGYPGQKTDDQNAEGPPPGPSQPWMADGSYLVWRRLEQKVLKFRDVVEEQAELLGMDSALLAARMVGRWPSGAPLILAPLQDDHGLGADDRANNNFEFEDDPHQRRCPYAAHIRKTYPRDDLNSALGPTGEAGVQTHRIRRSGIPFGPELTDAEEEAGVDQHSRGLMFVCYQTSIAEQFEFVQKDWANNPGFVFGKSRPAGGGGGPVDPGHDPIIGQVGGPRVMDEPAPNYPMGDHRSQLDLADQFVTSTAGLYLFTPSLSALRSAPLNP